jgi:hypothetical protein
MHKVTLIVLMAAVIGGCHHHEHRMTARTVMLNRDTVVTDGLSTAVLVNRERYSPGEYIDVYVRLTNMTAEPITISADSPDPVKVVLYRDTQLGWQRVQEYPLHVKEFDNPWTVAPGQQKVFSIPVLVGTEFPESTYVRLVVEISGLPKVQPAVTLWVMPSTVLYDP